MSIELKDKLYTSTQVADILGVSLRTLYRYMEDSKIQSMRTASGRHRFTKDQILDFLNAGGMGGAANSTSNFTPQQSATAGNVVNTPVQTVETDEMFTSPIVNPEPVAAPAKVESMWSDISPESELVGQAVVKPIEQEEVRSTTISRETNIPVNNWQVTPQAEPRVEPKPEPILDTSTVAPVSEAVDLSDVSIRYYKSDYTDLIELARKVKDTSSSKDLEYAFTLFAGLSLHFSIKPFTKLHLYANPEDMQIWKSELRLTPVQNREDANIGVLINTDIIFVPSKDIGGFRVVEDKVLMKDLSQRNEEELVREFRQRLTSL